MPEGPELHLASRFINRVCQGRIFGKILKSEISKNPPIVPPSDSYTISASSRGKEIKVTLSPVHSSGALKKVCDDVGKPLDILFTFGLAGKFELQKADDLQKHSHMNFFTADRGPAMALSFVDYMRFGKWSPGANFSFKQRGPCVLYDYSAFRSSGTVKDSGSGGSKSLDILFTFGMSGKFEFQKADDLQKHSHLNFFTADGGPAMALSFVDYRRFGKWVPGADLSYKERGPCVLYEYKAFRENVLTNVEVNAFDKPICEVLLNQKYFNGIGNYLRAEILYRAGIPPFVSARSVLAPLAGTQNVKCEKPDVLQLCNILPLEVVALEGSWYNGDDVTDAFSNWLQCYYQDGMKNISDHNKRTVWYAGPLGPLAPKDGKTRAKKTSKKKQKTTTPDSQAAEDTNTEDKKKKISRKRLKTEVKDEKDGIEPRAKKPKLLTGKKTAVKQEETNSEGQLQRVVPHLTRNQMKQTLEEKQEMKSQTSKQKKQQKVGKLSKNRLSNGVNSVPDEKEELVEKTPLHNGAPYLSSSRARTGSIDVADTKSTVANRKRRNKPRQ